MKTETQIAEENIKLVKSGTIASDYKAKEHKATCLRFLEFLEIEHGFCSLYNCMICEKITDLKQAIKLYNGAGI